MKTRILLLIGRTGLLAVLGLWAAAANAQPAPSPVEGTDPTPQASTSEPEETPAPTAEAEEIPAPTPAPTPKPEPTPAPAPTDSPEPQASPTAEPTGKPDAAPKSGSAESPNSEEPAADKLEPWSTEGKEEVKLPSGLAYIDIKVGEGDSPRSGARVKMHYTGWLENGAMFDTSHDDQEPFTFNTHRGVIEGWIEGVSGMRVGGKRRLIVPPALGYGDRERNDVPANSTLLFDIELLEIVEQGPEQHDIKGLESHETESGLAYWDIEEGTGETPDEHGKVNIDFSVWLADGLLLGTTTMKDQDPYNGLLQRIPSQGFIEGLKTMKEGGLRRLRMPPSLASNQPPEGHAAEQDWIAEIRLHSVVKPLPQTPVDDIEPVVTGSDLKYWDIKVGEGPTPEPGQTITVHYTGWLKDGSMFETSRNEAEPRHYDLNKVIRGWKEGVAGMKVGGIRRLEVPPFLGWGPMGRPPNIPPNATLIYEVELLGVEDPAAEKTDSKASGSDAHAVEQVKQPEEAKDNPEQQPETQASPTPTEPTETTVPTASAEPTPEPEPAASTGPAAVPASAG